MSNSKLSYVIDQDHVCFMGKHYVTVDSIGVCRACAFYKRDGHNTCILQGTENFLNFLHDEDFGCCKGERRDRRYVTWKLIEEPVSLGSQEESEQIDNRSEFEKDVANSILG